MTNVVHVVNVHGQFESLRRMPDIQFFQELITGHLMKMFEHKKIEPGNQLNITVEIPLINSYSVTITVTDNGAKISISTDSPEVWTIFRKDNQLMIQDFATREVDLLLDTPFVLPNASNNRMLYYIIYSSDAGSLAEILHNLLKKK